MSYDPQHDPDMNPGVVRLVSLLRAEGFETCDSGDGEAHKFACDYPTAHVFCVVQRERAFTESERMLALLRAQGVAFDPATGRSIDVTYSPIDGHTLLNLYGVGDADLPPEVKP